MGGRLPAIVVTGRHALGRAFWPVRPRSGLGEYAGYFHRPRHCRRLREPGSCLFGAEAMGYNRNYLTRTLGVSNEKIDGMVASGLNILSLKIGVLDERVHWLRERLRLEESEMKKIAQQQPRILICRSVDSLEPTLSHLQKRLVLDDNSLRKLIVSYPAVLGFSIKDNIARKLDWLKQRLGLEDAAVRKMLTRNPVIFGYSIDSNLEPKLDWLQHRLGLDAAAVSKMITRLPTIFHYSIDTNLEPKLDWLQQRLDLDDAAACKMIKRLPGIFSCTVDNMEAKLDWLQQRLGLEDAAVSKLVQQLPSILGCNVQTNLEPTLNFYIDALGEEEEVLAMVANDPILFSFSLEKRLKPRLKEARDAGLLIDSSCLKRIANYTNDQWYASLCFQTEARK